MPRIDPVSVTAGVTGISVNATGGTSAMSVDTVENQSPKTTWNWAVVEPVEGSVEYQRNRACVHG